MSDARLLTAHIGVGQILIYTVPFLLFGEHLRQNPEILQSRRVLGMSRAALERAYRALLIVILLAATLLVSRIVVRTVLNPPGWDYQALWLYGHVADSGQNPYLPGPYHSLAGPGPFVEDFREEVLDVGAVYPPPTLLVFAAIGYLPMRVAIVPWMIVQGLAFLAMVFLLWRIFLPGSGAVGLALAFTLTLLLPGTITTFGSGQVNFIAVLCVLAAWRTRNRAASGAYLVGATVMKLLYGALWLYPVLRRRWHPLIGIFLAGAGAMLASLAVLGPHVIATYVTDNPVVHRMPSYYFMTNVNQSLLGASLRLIPYHMPAFGPPTHHPLYIISAAIVGLITVLLVVRAPHNAQGEALALTLLLLGGMLIYPWTLSNYFVILLVPMGFLWATRKQSLLGVVGTTILLSTVYPITYIQNGRYSILATIFLWLAICVIATHAIRASREASKRSVNGAPLDLTENAPTAV